MGGLAPGPPSPPTLGAAPGNPGRSSKYSDRLLRHAIGHWPAERGGTTQKYTVCSPSGSLTVIVFRGFQSPMS